jgi:hypothetical protein
MLLQNVSAFVVRNRTTIKTVVVLGLAVVTVVGLALGVDATAFADGGSGGGTYCPGC